MLEVERMTPEYIIDVLEEGKNSEFYKILLHYAEMIEEGLTEKLINSNDTEDEKLKGQIIDIRQCFGLKGSKSLVEELIEDLDDLPFPAWDLIDPKYYSPNYYLFKIKRLPVATIFTTRGCPHTCSFCASTNLWRNQIRKRSPKNVVDEIEYLMNEFGVREIQIGDDYFNCDRKHVIEICREVVQRRLDIIFSCPNGLRIETLDKKLLTIMRKAGYFVLALFLLILIYHASFNVAYQDFIKSHEIIYGDYEIPYQYKVDIVQKILVVGDKEQIKELLSLFDTRYIIEHVLDIKLQE